ncbi:MAG: hypothetical protein ABI600_04625 [Luteolibacter sp.]
MLIANRIAWQVRPGEITANDSGGRWLEGVTENGVPGDERSRVTRAKLPPAPGKHLKCLMISFLKTHNQWPLDARLGYPACSGGVPCMQVGVALDARQGWPASSGGVSCMQVMVAQGARQGGPTYRIGLGTVQPMGALHGEHDPPVSKAWPRWTEGMVTLDAGQAATGRRPRVGTNFGAWGMQPQCRAMRR